MASGTISPRQKMINMMYLVLTAMLALNVSKDILRVLAKLDLGMNATVTTVERGTATLYQAIQAQVSENPRAVPVNERAKQVKSKSDEIFALLASTKEDMIKLTGGLDEEGRYKGADNRDIPENYLLNDKSIGGQGKAKEIKEKLTAFRTFLEGQSDGDATMKRIIDETFTFEDEVVEGKKMSKSLGNVLTVHDLLNDWPGEVLRYVLLTAHYRQPLDWSNKVLKQAQTNLDRLYQRLQDHGGSGDEVTKQSTTADALTPDQIDDRVLEALEDDLNTPTALAALNQLAKELDQAPEDEKHRLAERLANSGRAMGLLMHDPAGWFAARQTEIELSEEAIEAKIAQRNEARAAKDFAQSDAIRDELLAAGIVIKDGPEGTTWEVAKR